MYDGTIKIRLYGEAILIRKLGLNPEYYNRFYDIANKLNQPIEEALLDIRFFQLLNIKQYKSLYDMELSDSNTSFKGLIQNGKDRIEINKGRKRLMSITIRNLIVMETLFPLYNVSIKELNIRCNNALFIIEREVGLIAEYQVKTELFEIDKLSFSIGQFNNLRENNQILFELRYNEELLESQKSDTLLTYRNCINKLKKDI